MRKAVDTINDDLRPWLKCLLEEVPAEYGKLSLDDFYLGRFRYVYPRPYSQDDFDHIQNWMADWGVLERDSTYDKIIGEDMRAGISA